MELAKELIRNMSQFRKVSHQKKIDETLRGEAFAIIYISKKSSGVLPGELSGEMSISSARIAAVLNSLENKGLITRRIDRDDRRRILVDLTAQGADLAKKYDDMAIDGAVRMLEALGEHDAGEFVRILGKLSGIARSGDTG